MIPSRLGCCFSSDGDNWQIQLFYEDSINWGSLNYNNKITRFYRYGFWNPKSGLTRLPLAANLPVDEFAEICQQFGPELPPVC